MTNTFQTALNNLKKASKDLSKPGGRTLDEDFAIERGYLTKAEEAAISARDKTAYPAKKEEVQKAIQLLHDKYPDELKEFLENKIQKCKGKIEKIKLTKNKNTKMVTVDGTTFKKSFCDYMINVEQRKKDQCERLMDNKTQEDDLIFLCFL